MAAVNMERTILNANQNWRFYRGEAPVNRRGPWDIQYDDSGWEVVHLPHTVRTEPLMASGCINYQGEAWYRRRFVFDADTDIAGKDLIFELEGAMQRADAWLDGVPLGCAEGGFLPAAFDLTGKISAGTEHIIVIRVDNGTMPDVPPGKPQGALDFCYFGGLYRDANFIAAGKLRFSLAVHEGKPASGGVYVTYPVVTKEEALVRVKAHILNHTGCPAKGKLRILLSINDETISHEKPFEIAGGDTEATIEFPVKNPRLWHPYHPHLYKLTAQVVDDSGVVVDEINERIGIRSIKFTADGFYINGEKLFLSGANRHQEFPYTGFALPDSIQKRDAFLLRKAGMILIRTAHYPQDKAFMDACDELGLLCIIPTPGWQIHPSSVKFDFASYENTRRMIRCNRNHPSAALWEPILNETDYPEYFAKKQLEIVREETACAEGEERNDWAACDREYAYSSAYSVNYRGRSTEEKPFAIREYGDNYTEQFGPMQTLRRVRRGAHTGFYLGGEKAMIRSAGEHFEAYCEMRSLPGLCAAAMWAGIDHNRGYEENEAAVGMLDFLRLPKFSYYMYDAQQNRDRAGTKCYIAGFWDVSEIEAENTYRDVVVYTNAEAIRLSLNGKEISTLTVKHDDIPEEVYPPLTFKNVPFEKGELTAVALVDGKTAAAYTVHTPGKAVRLVLAPQWENVPSWIADGSDLLLVHVSAVDAVGTVVSSCEKSVNLSISGDAEIVGDGEAWTGANPVLLEAGISGVLLRAGTHPGKVTVRAEAEGLDAVELSLETKLFDEPRLAGPEEIPPQEKPRYPSDTQKRFSPLMQLRFEKWYHFNLAKDKLAKASSSAPGFPPVNAARGIIGDPWLAADASMPQWWQCDLGESAAISGVSIFWQHDGLWYDYSVAVSDDEKNWETLKQGHSSGQSHIPVYFAEPAVKRFLRINIHAVSGGNPAGIFLVELYGEPRRAE
ncbi:beta-galactosidase [Spirochaetia bacterium]|nr:beta-galactosidase [Spirochaetia bacterium]